MNYAIYILYTYILFFSFFIIISIFGMIILKIFKILFKWKWKLTFLQNFIVSSGIGISFYISIIFLIKSFLSINFFTIYLPILVLDSIFVLNLISKNKDKYRKYFSIKNVKEKLWDNKIFILILLIIITLKTIFDIDIIFHNIALMDTDPYFFVTKTYDVLKYDEYWNLQLYYPEGFTNFCVGCISLLIHPSYELTYFFFKFASLPLTNLYILIIAYFVKSIFKKNFYVFISLILVLSSNYFNFRLFFFIPSNLATLLVLICLLMVYLNLPFYLLGIIIGGIFLINPIAFFFYFIIIILTFIIRRFYFKIPIKKFLIENIKFIISLILILIPFIIFLYLNNFTIFDLINSYRYTMGLSPIPPNVPKLIEDYVPIIIDDPIIEFLSNWIPIENQPWNKYYYVYDSLIFSFYFIFAIFSLFISIRRINNENKRILLINIKITILLILFFFFLPIILGDLFLTFVPFWIRLRMLEFLCGPLIIGECFAIYYIIKKCKFLFSIIKTKIKRSIKPFKKIKFDHFLMLLFILSAFNVYNVNLRTNKYPWYANYHFSSEKIEMLLFANKNFSIDSKILVQNHTKNPNAFNYIYYCFFSHLEYFLWDFSDIRDYNTTKSFIKENDIDYLLIDYSYTDERLLNLLKNNINDFLIIFENNKNAIFKVIGNLTEDYPTGLFYSTWDFFNEDDETFGSDIEFINWYENSYNCYASIKSILGDHKKILDFYMNNINGSISAYNYFDNIEKSLSSPEFGTIEYWWQSNDASQESKITLYINPNIRVIDVRIYENYIQVFNGTSWLKIEYLNSNNWYHFRIDFDCGENYYNELSQDRFHLFLNNNLIINNFSFINHVDNINKIRIYTSQNSNDFHTYFDAFGYSWDHLYNVGDNFFQIYM